ncbi:rhamnulokinase [Clostridium chauvoei]|uniref:Rhamnulokinase n=3 Tax=Clostridium chauvoei TaxID=46867 RepID=A0ABD4RDW1_9CLOT|nr:rhamnulokinase family protein [Clostridium chauvoei]ATD55043.1 rhamnulokinase [Clostridium chauvoei]MBX7279386.1 rhamnulokinase [Clostridium chauvoei]MBX7282528.1 rhamnulokinase [Clostridium chauvoei]MBX7285584.1 rhamnulokinase [Clostridium chauvoei]MBX7287340.1 rhamnulokinase [Clostridium chauvoei]
MSTFLAFDFGASSGRAIIARITNDKIEIEEIYRFPNEPVFLGDKYFWDFPRLLNDMKVALKKVSLLNEKIAGIGIDTWGVDYGLLDDNENLIGMPMHYRDKRTYSSIKETKEIISLEELYLKTGISLNAFNTSFQLVADKMMRPEILKNSTSLLFMPDLFAYYLTGSKKNEFTIASTSGLLDIKKRTWDYELIDKLGIPTGIFNEIIEPGEIYGYLTKDVMEETGLGKIPVIAVGGHDTASAVAATPFTNTKNAFLSSGTWSLLGVEIESPIINDKTFNYSFTNEGGVCNKVRLLKNINGLWLLQQLKKTWCEFYEKIDFPDIIKEAKKFEKCTFIVNTSDERLMNTKNMIESIKEYCVENGQGTPEKLGELAMAVYNGLTKEYKETIEEIEEVLGYKINAINVVGGGIKDSYLCELTAKRTGKNIIAGPVEAAILGNVILQCISVGLLSSIKEGRNLVYKSFDIDLYIP